MANGTMKPERHFGAWENITLPYTADSDGFIYIYANPSSSSGGSAIVRVGDQPMGIVCPNGAGISNIMPIAKGASAILSSASGVTVTARIFKVIG